jgi:hypothetical protein
LLKLEGLGFSQAEIVKELSQKNASSKRTIYSDFEACGAWQLILQGNVPKELEDEAAGGLFSGVLAIRQKDRVVVKQN